MRNTRTDLIARLADIAAIGYGCDARQVISSDRGHKLASGFFGQDEDGEIDCTWRQLARLEKDVNSLAVRITRRTR